MNQIHPDTYYRIQRSAQKARIARSRQPNVEPPMNKSQFPKGSALVAMLLASIEIKAGSKWNVEVLSAVIQTARHRG